MVRRLCSLFIVFFFLSGLSVSAEWMWNYGNTTGTRLLPQWGDERSNAVKQIAKDLYENPVNNGSGNARLFFPLESTMPVADGIVLSNSTVGATVTVSIGLATSTVASYVAEVSWQEDPGSYSGDLFAEKTLVASTTTATLTILLKNSGSATGKKIGYKVFRKAVP